MGRKNDIKFVCLCLAKADEQCLLIEMCSWQFLKLFTNCIVHEDSTLYVNTN